MHSLPQIHSQNETAARGEFDDQRKALLNQGRAVLTKVDEQRQLDLNFAPLGFDSYDAAKGYLNRNVPLHKQAEYIIHTP